MPADLTPSDFATLFRRGLPLLDVRSPVEFARGAFPTSRNIPLLSDAQYAAVGTTYRRRGGEAALALGRQLVAGAARERLIQRWRDFAGQNPSAQLYCFRGGQRSRIARQWLRETHIDLPRVPGGYKAMRGFLLQVLERAALRDWLVIAGKTGSGKTRLLAGLRTALDIEGAARHRGSAFGALPEPQPSQIDFENRMAVALLRPELETAPVLIVEDEGRAVGSLAIPHALFKRMGQSPLWLIEESLESRVENILQDYVLANLAAWEQHRPGAGADLLRQSLLASLGKIRRRLGETGFRQVDALMRRAFGAGGEPALSLHRQWIALLLANYYDPMYEFQLARKLPRVRQRGTYAQIAEAAQFAEAAQSAQTGSGRADYKSSSAMA